MNILHRLFGYRTKFLLIPRDVRIWVIFWEANFWGFTHHFQFFGATGVDTLTGLAHWWRLDSRAYGTTFLFLDILLLLNSRVRSSRAYNKSFQNMLKTFLGDIEEHEKISSNPSPDMPRISSIETIWFGAQTESWTIDGP